VEVLYIDYSGPSHAILQWLAGRSGSPNLFKLVERIRVDSASRRNPRTAQYMAALIEGRGNAGTVVRVTDAQTLDPRQLGAARTIVLLWRDGNGCGWSRVERIVFRHKRPECPVLVLNGRRREFVLTPSIRRTYLLRRFVEKTLLPEMAAFMAFVLLSPLLVAWDVLRGRS
jgi:hypothetical protein